MTDYKDIPLIVREIMLNTIQRIDVGLEGNWSPTVVTVWSREHGEIGFSEAILSHPDNKPSLELYFEDSWLGIHCFNRINGKNVFDEVFATRIIEFVESRC
jgi:hypothetical protein